MEGVRYRLRVPRLVTARIAFLCQCVRATIFVPDIHPIWRIDYPGIASQKTWEQIPVNQIPSIRISIV